MYTSRDYDCGIYNTLFFVDRTALKRADSKLHNCFSKAVYIGKKQRLETRNRAKYIGYSITGLFTNKTRVSLNKELMKKKQVFHKQLGFTLLEVLIGMSLLSVMMLLLFASLRICVQNWNAGEKKIAQVSQAAIVQNFLRSKLHSTLPLSADFFEEEQFSFQGGRDKLQFVTSMPASAGRLGLQLFNLSLEKSSVNEGSQLLVDIKPFFPQNDEWEEEQVIILKKIKSLSFSYFGSEKNSDDPDWQNDWQEQNRLPDLIAVDVELNNGEVWPQLVVALKIDATVRGGGSNPFGIVNGKFQRP